MSPEEAIDAMATALRGHVTVKRRLTSRAPLSTLDTVTHAAAKASPDRFHLEVSPPAAVATDDKGTQVCCWELLFSGQSTEFPPDFIFASEPDFLPTPTEVPELIQWNPAAAGSSLTRLIEQLIAARRNRVLARIQNHHIPAVRAAYATTLGTPAFEAGHRTHCTEFDTEDASVLFAVELTHIGRGLPRCAEVLAANKTPPIVRITFSPAGEARPIVRIPAALATTIGEFSPPSWGSAESLGHYVTRVEGLIAERLKQCITEATSRRAYMSAMLSHFGVSVLEYDLEESKRMSFLFSEGKFYAIIHITFESGKSFPAVQPTFTMQSVYKLQQGKPVTVVISDYPYSPRWSMDEMCARARSFLRERLPKFQREIH